MIILTNHVKSVNQLFLLIYFNGSNSIHNSLIIRQSLTSLNHTCTNYVCLMVSAQILQSTLPVSVPIPNSDIGASQVFIFPVFSSHLLKWFEDPQDCKWSGSVFTGPPGCRLGLFHDKKAEAIFLINNRPSLSLSIPPSSLHLLLHVPPHLTRRSRTKWCCWPRWPTCGRTTSVCRRRAWRPASSCASSAGCSPTWTTRRTTTPRTRLPTGATPRLSDLGEEWSLRWGGGGGGGWERLGSYEDCLKKKETHREQEETTRTVRLRLVPPTRTTQNPSIFLEPSHPRPEHLVLLSKTIRYYAAGGVRRWREPRLFLQNFTRRGLILFLQPISQKHPAELKLRPPPIPQTTHYSQSALLLCTHATRLRETPTWFNSPASTLSPSYWYCPRLVLKMVRARV